MGLSVWLVLPAQSLARALVRFVHGVPGVGRAEVSVDAGTGAVDMGSIGFGQHTPWHSIRSGTVRWSLSGAGRPLAGGSATVGRGAYDILVLSRGSRVTLRIYRAHGGTPGTSLVRVIHGAPELGSPQLMVDGSVAVKRLAYTRATPYVPLAPGTHTLAADRRGDGTPLVSSAAMTVQAGRAYTAVVLGTRGQRVRVVTLVDRGAPLVRRARRGGSPAHRPGTFVVASGDSLWSIASRLAGPGASAASIERRLVSIWDANATRIGTGDPNLIFPGTRLHV